MSFASVDEVYFHLREFGDFLLPALISIGTDDSDGITTPDGGHEKRLSPPRLLGVNTVPTLGLPDTPQKMGSDPEVEGSRHRLTGTDAGRQGEGEGHFDSPLLPPNTLPAIPAI